MFSRKSSWIFLISALSSLVLLVAFTGCGGHSNPVSVAVTAAATTVDGSDTTTLSATVTNDQNASGVSWSMNGPGTISGETTTSATYKAPSATSSSQSVTITATSVADASKTGSATITIPAAPAVTTTSANLAGAVGTPLSLTLQGSGGIPPYKNWAVYTAGGGNSLPSCLTLSSAGVITTASGTAPAASCAGTYSNLYFQFIDSGTPTPLTATSSALTITITAPSITFAPALPQGAVGAPYAGSVAATGPVGATTYSIASGALPPDLTLNTSSGAITGTPKAADAGTATFAVNVVDAYGDTATSGNMSITITAAPVITFGSAPTGTATFGVAYSSAVSATGGAGTLTYGVASGALPPDLTLSASGAITGTPKAADIGTFTFAVKAADAYGDSATSANYTIVVSYPAVTITPAAGSLPLAVTGQAYTQTLTAAGGSGVGFTWTVTGLPASGLSYSANGATLTVSGPATAAGTVNFTASVTDGAGNTNTGGALSYSIQVYSPVTLPASIPASLPSTGTVNLPYSGTVTASGGSGNYSWTVTGLSDGLTSSTSGGTLTISGTPAAAATVTASVSVKDTTTSVTASETYTITVFATVTLPTTNPATLGLATVGSLYTGTVTAAGGSGNYSWTLTGLPANGLNDSTSAGTLTISGTPTSAQTVSFTAKVTDTTTNQSAGPYTYTVTAYNAVALNSSSLPATATVNTPYSGSITASGGSGTGYTFTVTGLSDGLTSSSSGNTLTISGTPTAAATVSFTVKVTDSAGLSAGPVNESIAVYNPLTLPTSNPSTLGPATINALYGGTIAASGGSGNYSWTVTGLPSDSLNYSASGGTLTISGTPGSATTVSFTAKVTDTTTNISVGPYTYTVTVYNTLTLPSPNPASLPSYGTVSTAYTGSITAAGGSGNYTFTVTGLSDNLSSSTSGATLNISGTPLSTATVSFNVTVRDSTTGVSVGPYIYTITVYNALALPATNPSTLGPATVNLVYGGTIVASGGSGNYSWTVTGLPSDSLNYSSSGGTLTISGTPPTAATVSFNVSVNDTTTGVTVGPYAYSVTVYSGVTLPSPNPSTLGPADANSAYNGTIVVAGGSGNYSWTVTGLPSDGLSYSTSGATLTISGTPTSAQTVSFTAKVTDTSSNQTAGPLTYSITVNGPLSLPAPDPSSLPSTGYTGVSYTGYINASGGSGSYSWSVSGLSDGLNVSGGTTGSTLAISGTPATTAYVTFNVTLKDTVTGATVTVNGYNITISNPTPVSLPAPNPATLGSATVSQSYSGSINVSGGVGPYTWSINGNSVGSSGYSLGNGTLAAYSSGGSSLTVNGTPSSIGTVTLTSVKVVDSMNTSATQTYTIAVNSAGSQVSGNISLLNYCGGTNGFTMPTFTVSINTSPVQTTTTDSNGNYSFASIPNGTYTITPSITGPSSLFSPATLANVVVNNNAINNQNFQAELGYTVSGTVSYSGSATGQVYVELDNSSCGPSNGTSISAPGAFTIHGVAPGNYSISAWMDTIGFGAMNASDPSSGSANLTVSNSNLGSQTVTITNPGTITLSSAPSLPVASGFAEGVALNYQPITTTINNNQVEMAASYNVQWSTSSSFTSVAGSTSFAATGTNGAETWIINVADVSGLTAGSSYYFRAQGVAGSSTSSWSSPVGPITVEAPSGANTVAGQVTWSGAATGPLYVGFFSPNTNQVWMTQVGTKTTPPTSPANYSVQVPSGTGYYFFGLIDQNNSGLFAPGDPTNTNGGNGPPTVNISGNTTENMAMPTAGSVEFVPVTYSQTTSGSTVSTSYNLRLRVYSANLLPVAATIESGPNLVSPVDMEKCTDCGSGEIDYNPSLLNGATPNVGDTYTFQVTYSNKTTASVTAAVTGWNGTSTIVGASDVATLTSPAGSSITDTPNFSWTYPANASDYIYNFWLCCSNNNTIWAIPSYSSNANGFNSSQVSPPLTWGVDPTNSSNTPSPASLSAGSNYSWSIQAQDTYGNSANATMNFTTVSSGPLSLPSPNPSTLPSATAGQAYNGTITATGGIAPYQYLAGNSSCYGCNPITLSDGLSVTDAHDSTLVVGGTPTAATQSGSPVSFPVTVKDSSGATYGPITYTITVQPAGAVSLPSPNPSSLGPATVDESYSGAINASGGLAPFTWSINGTTVGSSGYSLGNGTLSASNTGGNTLSITGMPSSAGTVTLTSVKVVDSQNTSATQTYTLAVNPVSSLAISINKVPQGMVNMPYTFSDLSISGGVSPYNVTYSNVPAWLSQPSGTWNLVGTPTSQSSSTITVNVTDSASNHQSTTFTVNVVPETVAINNSEIKGQYACYLQMYYDGGVTGGTGATLYRGGMVLAIAVDGNGNITGGEGDYNSPTSGGGYSHSGPTSGGMGSYAVGSDNRGYMLLGPSASNLTELALAGGSLNSSGQFNDFSLIFMNDVGTSPTHQHGNGHCYLQNTTGLSGIQPSGGYAWGLMGEDSHGNLEAEVGSGTYSSGNFSGEIDIADDGTYQGPISVSGTNTATDAYGRMTVTAGPAGQTANPSVWYLTNNSVGEVLGMSANPHNAASDADFQIGVARAQVATHVSAAYPLDGPFVMYMSGADSSLENYKSQVMQAVGSSNATTVTANIDISNDAGTLKSQTPGAVTYTYSTGTGRGSFNGENAGADIFYVYDTNSAVVLFADGQTATSVQDQLGWIEPQTAPGSGAWTTSDLAASYFMSTMPNGDYNNSFSSGAVSSESSGSITYFAQDEGGQGEADWDETMSSMSLTSGSFVPYTTLDPNGDFGIFETNFTQNGTPITVSYCIAISVDNATSSSTKGRVVCVDGAGKESPQISISQE